MFFKEPFLLFLVDLIGWDRKSLYLRISIGQEKVITLLLGMILLIAAFILAGSFSVMISFRKTFDLLFRLFLIRS